MNGIDIIKEAMKSKGWTMSALAKELGYATPNGVRSRLTQSKNLRVDVFVKFLNEMGFEVVVLSKTGSKEQWILTENNPED